MKKILLRSALLLLVLASCSDSTTVFETKEDNFDAETNEATLTSSIDYSNSGVLDIVGSNGSSIGNSRFVDEQAGKFPLSLVAQVQGPTISGISELTATHVVIDNDIAYIAYNVVGEEYGCAADIVDVSNPESPQLRSRIFSRSIDFNSVAVIGNTAYFVGGIDAEQSAIATANSIIVKIGVVNNRFNLNDLTFGFQEGFNANDIVAEGNSIFVSSGRDGLVTQYNATTLEVINEAPFPDLRSVATRNGTSLVLDASLGVRYLDDSLNETSQIAINSDFRSADKRTLDFMDDQIIVAEGSNGAGLYDFNSGVFQEYIPITIAPDNVSDSDIVTNATAFNEGVILMANGGAGLSISEENNNNIQTVGVIELGGSINFVASKGDYIFAASGREGLQIIKLNRASPSLLSRCENLPTYSGSANLTVNVGEELAYTGQQRFRSFTINGSLLLCGSWTTREDTNVNENALFEMNGIFVNGRNRRRRNLNIADGATVRIEGSITIYGDIVMGENATLEFIGTDSSANVFGGVIRAGSAEVIGEFDDVQSKF